MTENRTRSERIDRLKKLLRDHPQAGPDVRDWLDKRRKTEASESAPTAATTADAEPMSGDIITDPDPRFVRASKGTDFSFIFFSDADDRTAAEQYDLAQELAEFGDREGFKAVWLPERHFHSFGGAYARPSVLAAALARTTNSIRLRAGSVILPLHHPLEVVEEWAMVDNLSGGRVDLGFASGWNPNDFILSPHTFENHRDVWFERIDEVKALWRGESRTYRNGLDEEVAVKAFPSPVQTDLDIWLVITKRDESFVEAGRRGLNILTMLMGITLEGLSRKIGLYRQARAESGFDPDKGVVSLMMHTFVHHDETTVIDTVREPLMDYIRKGLGGHTSAMRGDDTPEDKDTDRIVNFAFERYYRTGAIFGTPETSVEKVNAVRNAGVDEISCLMDFGPSHAKVSESLPYLAALKQKITPSATAAPHRGARSSGADEPIAVIGMSGRFPGSPDVDALWTHLEKAETCFSDPPENRWPDGSPSIKAGFMDDVEGFDPLHFKMSPSEAAAIDPHQRLFLTETWKALEDSGHAPESLSGQPVGVFAAMYNTDFLSGRILDAAAGKPGQPDDATGSAHCLVPNRVSYALNLTGPSELIDTACSSSLVAVHRAANALRNGECSLALAGGVSVILSPHRIEGLRRMGIMSSTGDCRAFDAEPTGQVMGEGVGVVVLKRLSDALADNDQVLGILRGSAVNHHGDASGTITMPERGAQMALIEQACQRAGISPTALSYIESHGAGGHGDLVELDAFQKVIQKAQADVNLGQTCLVGSLKPNIGFLEAAGGISQLIKVLLMMRHGKIPTTLAGTVPEELELDQGPCRIATTTQDWVAPKDENGKTIPRIAGIHAYGLGGTNAHLIIEEPQLQVYAETKQNAEHLIVLSARTPERLRDAAEGLRDHLQNRHGAVRLENVAYTLQVGRNSMTERLFLVATDIEDVTQQLSNFVNNPERFDAVRATAKRTGKVWKRPEGKVDWSACAKAWLGGARVAWGTLWSEPKPARISLPSYPFENRLLSTPRTDASRPAHHSSEGLEEAVSTVLRDVLDLAETDTLDLDQPFSEYGVGSLQGVRLVEALAERFAIDLKATVLFRHPSVRTLAAHLATAHDVTLDKAPQQPTAPTRAPALESITAAPEPSTANEPIAVVGMAGRFPGAPNTRHFWSNLRNGVTSIIEVPKSRWDADEFFDPDPNADNRTYAKWGGFIQDVDRFDSLFFNISPAEAEVMDPQQRLFMQVCWQAFEDAGLPPSALAKRRVGIYVGEQGNEYLELINNSQLSSRIGQAMVGNAISMLPARIAYFMDLRGPVLSVDTACSSSATAIHLACQALRNGEADVMVAGGSNLYLSERPYIMMSRAGMLSPTGICRAFDDGADGMVPGEAVAAVVLKRLSQAQADGDHIYGVIRASGLNQDGRSNGITAPNAEAQVALERAVYDQAGINPATISYVEAHGTGTPLGDPVEISALSEAFNHYTQERNFCAVGSVKSNIGHTSAAAGVVSLIKVLLALRHQEIPPTLNVERENHHIDFATSPFFVNQTLRSWVSDTPRRAALSSFGFSGTNVHMVIEEAPAIPAVAPRENQPPLVFPLSARSKNDLEARARDLEVFINGVDHDVLKKTLSEAAGIPLNAVDLSEPLSEFGLDPHGLTALAHILGVQVENLHGDAPVSSLVETDGGDGPAIRDIAFSLQTGRDPMEERAVFVAQNRGELLRNIAAYLQGNTQALENDDAPSRMAQSWVAGKDVNWQDLYEGVRPRRIPLPVYPFMGPALWMVSQDDPASSMPSLHPLLSANRSTLDTVAFVTHFTSENTVLAHHVVGDIRILPAVAYLEMARAAGTLAEERPVTQITNTAWSVPMALTGKSLEARVTLSRRKSGVAFEVVSGPDKTVHAQGYLRFDPPHPVAPIDVTAIRKRCSDHKSKAEIYTYFKQSGLAYGPTFQVIEDLWAGQGEALSVLHLPMVGQDDAYALPPGLLDAALQTIAGHEPKGAGQEARMPFSLDALTIHGPLTNRCLAYVQEAERTQPSAPVRRFNVSLLNDSGTVLVQMQGYVARPLKSVSQDKAQTVLLTPHWKPRENPAGLADVPTPLLVLGRNQADADAARSALRAAGIDGAVISAERAATFHRHDHENFSVDLSRREDIQKMFEDLAESDSLPVAVLNVLPMAPGDSPETAMQAAVHPLLFLGQLLSERGTKPIPIIQVHTTTQNIPGAVAEAAGAMALTWTLECPQLVGRSVEVPTTTPDMAALLREVALNNDGSDEIRLMADRREVRVWTPAPDQPHDMAYKDGGVYLITGAFGGLGTKLARHLAQTVKDVRLVLVGRSRIDAGVVGELETLGAEVLATRADIAEDTQVNPLLKDIQRRFGQLDGLFHVAGITQDGLLRTKTVDSIEAVAHPKINGLLHLERAIVDVFGVAAPLDFIALFSSAAAARGNIGQGDYAFANRFLDAYASLNNTDLTRIVAIDWPLWAEGGMKAAPETERWMADTLGILPLQTDTGFGILDHVLGNRALGARVMALYGNRDRILSRFTAAPEVTFKPHSSKASRDISSGDARELIVAILAKELKLPPEQLLPKDAFERFGIDSILAMSLTRALEQDFGELSKTLFFEYQTIGELVDHFHNEHSSRLAEMLGKDDVLPEDVDLHPAIAAPVQRPARTHEPASDDDAIAIVGVSGRYPGAKDLSELWDNLRNGRDSITEIPDDRFEWRSLFDPDRTRYGNIYAKWGGFIEGVDCFDSLFFNISPREAEFMDPQERLFLECAWQTLEDASIAREKIAGRSVGVFVGTMYGEYQLLGAEETARGNIIATSSFYSAIANRVSHFLDLRGPSLAVDTMCSSSLTALSLACAAIRNGDCEAALVGGVNVSIHLNKYLTLSQGRFASSDGRCRSFGDGGDGYVPGEGVGAIFIKPLSKALSDGDNVLALVRGTAMNHGGKTSGFTVPNPIAQGDLIATAFDRSGLDASRLSYLEAHGTGTSLGDPIEINGLKRALSDRVPKDWTCPIGSVKSNIGHLEGAAGIAGITKALLQMRHGELAPSIHSKTLNPNIRFEDTPFRVQRELQPWPRRIANGAELPHLAGISSFGAGGANAHVLLEEYIPTARPHAGPVSVSVLVVLSAADSAGLRKVANRLLVHLSALPTTAQTPEHLTEVAYTLQNGRSALEHRLAFMASDFSETIAILTAFSREETGPPIHMGMARNRGTLVDVPDDDAETETLIRSTIANRELNRLAALWCDGVPVTWNALYTDDLPRRVSLPSYPFARDRYWIETTQAPTQRHESGHPLLVGPLTTDKDQTVFEVSLTPDMALVSDHCVSGTPILPGVVFLELARASVRLMSGQDLPLRGLSWQRPVEVKATRILQIVVTPHEADFEIEMISDDGIHARCRTDHISSKSEENLQIEEIKARSQDHTAGKIIYPLLRDGGLDYGPTFQTLGQIWSSLHEAMAELTLKGTWDGYALPPGLLDGALQLVSSVGIVRNSTDPRPLMPFSLDSIDVYGSLGGDCVAHVVSLGGDRFDIFVGDMTGRVLVCLRGLGFRRLSDGLDGLFLTTQWRLSPVSAEVRATGEGPVWLISDSEVNNGEDALGAALGVLYATPVERLSLFGLDELPVERPGVIYVVSGVDGDGTTDTTAEEARILGLYGLVRGLADKGWLDGLTLKVITGGTVALGRDTGVRFQGAGLRGLAKSLSRELPSTQISVMDVGPLSDNRPDDVLTTAKALVLEPPHGDGEDVVLRRGARYLGDPKVLNLGAVTEVPLREAGVYLIIGGAGGLGRVLSEHLCATYNARVVWVGRRAEDATITAAMAAIAGGSVVYEQADGGNADALRAVIARTTARFGAVHGVIHSALVLRDGMAQTVSDEDVRAALAPKVGGGLALRDAVADMDLDFALIFSSAVSVSGNAGQGNYAAGSTFIDALGRAWNEAAAYPVQIINWGYWGEVGAVTDPYYAERMASMGVLPIRPPVGVEAVRRILGHAVDQVMPFRMTAALMGEMGLGDNRLTRQAETSPVLASAKATFPDIPTDELARQQEGFAALARFGRQGLAVALGELGTAPVIPTYTRLLAALQGMLDQEGLSPGAGSWAEQETARDDLEASYPEMAGYLPLLWACVRALPQVLQGTVSAPQVMFPGGARDLVEGVYAGNAVTDGYSRVIGDLVADWVRLRAKQAPGATIEIIEIGAGTGSATAFVLPALAKLKVPLRYRYTDVSKSFVERARETFKAYDFVDYEVLDINQPPVAQGFDLGTADVVIASNVLHATPSLDRTLDHVKGLLKTHGAIVVNEVTSVQDYATLTFGLTEGWWLYDEGDARLANSPLLDVGQWIDRLATHGFAGARTFGVPNVTALDQQQAVIAATSDGWALTDTTHKPPAKPAANAAKVTAQPTATDLDGHSQEDSVLAWVSGVFSKVLKLALEKLDADATFETFGVDSLIVLDINKVLAEELGPVPATLLFEQTTLKTLAAHITKNWPEFKKKHKTLETNNQHDRGAVSIIEHQAQSDVSANQDAYVVTLFARTEEGLRDQAVALKDLMSDQNGPTLKNVARPVGLGRSSNTTRLAFTAHTRQEAETKLTAYLESADGRLIFTGMGAIDADDLAFILNDDLIEVLLAKKDLERLALLWAKGWDVPWDKLTDAPVLTQPAPVQEIAFPLSFEQSWHWSLIRLMPEAAGLVTIPSVFSLTGPLSSTQLQAAVDAVVQRHPCLRTVFEEFGGDVQQRVLPTLSVPVTLTSGSPDQVLAALAPFDLVQGPLLYVVLTEDEDGQHWLVMRFHHIISDLWSVGLIVAELAAAYHEGADWQPTALPHHYRDFVRLEHDVLSPPVIKSRQEHWRQRLAGEETILRYPGYLRKRNSSNRAGHRTHPLSDDLATRLEIFCKAGNGTPFNVLATAFAGTMAGLSGQTLIPLGIPDANRTQAGFDRVVGFFANIQLAILRFDDSATAIDLLKITADALLEGRQMALPFSETATLMRETRDDPTAQPIQACCTLARDQEGGTAFGNIIAKPVGGGRENLVFDLFLTFVQNDTGFILNLEYLEDLFDAQEAQGILNGFERILAFLLEKTTVL